MNQKSADTCRFNPLRTPHFWLGAAVGLVALWLAASDVEWSGVAETLSKADCFFVVLALDSFVLTNCAKARRWRLLFYPRHSRLSGRRCVSVLFVGQLVNNLLLARSGEVVRAYLIGRSGISRVFALATIVVEKALDSVMLLVLIALLSLFTPMYSWLQRSSLIVSGFLVSLLRRVAASHRALPIPRIPAGGSTSDQS